eukprot:GSA25T00010502001.1
MGNQGDQCQLVPMLHKSNKRVLHASGQQQAACRSNRRALREVVQRILCSKWCDEKTLRNIAGHGCRRCSILHPLWVGLNLLDSQEMLALRLRAKINSRCIPRLSSLRTHVRSS